MASGQDKEFSVRAGQIVGQAQARKEDCNNSSQTSGFLQEKGEKVKNMAHEATEAVKNKLGMNNDNNNEYKNKNPLDMKNPNKTTCPSMPGHPPSDI